MSGDSALFGIALSRYRGELVIRRRVINKDRMTVLIVLFRRFIVNSVLA
jgi:hypothetical protein